MNDKWNYRASDGIYWQDNWIENRHWLALIGGRWYVMYYAEDNLSSINPQVVSQAFESLEAAKAAYYLLTT